MNKKAIGREKVGFGLGALLQGVVLGLALAAAIATLWSWSGAARTFRYEAF